MRGRPNRQRSMLTMVDLRERGPNDHLLGTLKSLADTVTARLSPARDRPLVRQGRTGIGAVRTLLKASLLAALYSVCSERALCGGGGYNLRNHSFDATVFTQNRQLLLAHGASRRNATHASTTDPEAP